LCSPVISESIRGPVIHGKTTATTRMSFKQLFLFFKNL
jgi:hypothetical protein